MFVVSSVLVGIGVDHNLEAGAPHGLTARIITFSLGMDAELEEEGGPLKVGLYAPPHGVDDLLDSVGYTV